VTTSKIKISLSQEMFNIMKPKERCSIHKLEKRLRKKGIEFSVIGLDEAAMQLIKERKVEISTWCWYYKRSRDLVVKEITRPQKTV
jgi:hypothetical protein